MKVIFVQILCFIAINAVSLIIAVINMQLLRLGLVNYTTIGKTFQKEIKDNHVIAALIVGCFEGLLCVMSTVASLKFGYDSKNNRFKSKRKDGTFFVQIIGEKEILVVRSKLKADVISKNMKRHKGNRLFRNEKNNITEGAVLVNKTFRTI